MQAIIVTAAEVSIPAFYFLFRKAAVQIARWQEKPALKKFKRDNFLVKPIEAELKAIAETLLETIDAAQETRNAAIARSKAMRIDAPNIAQTINEAQMRVTKAGEALHFVLGATVGGKVTHLYSDAVKKRMHEMKAHAAKKAAEEAAKGTIDTVDSPDTTVAAAATLVDSVDGDTLATAIPAGAADHLSNTLGADHGTLHDMATHMQDGFQHLGQGVAHALDQMGLVDLGAQIGTSATDVLADHAAGHAAEAGASILGDSFMIPGLLSTILTITKEFELSREADISNEERFESAIMPQMARSGFIAVGVALDIATLGASTGFFTFAGSIIGGGVNKAMINQANERLTGEINSMLRSIEADRVRTVQKMNTAIDKFNRALSAKIDACPDIADEPSIREYFKEVLEGYSEGMGETMDQLVANTQEKIANLPNRTWLDKILFIDRGKEIAKMYLAAQRQIESQSLGLLNQLGLALEKDVITAVKFIIDHPVFDSPKTHDALRKMEEATVRYAGDYANTLTNWENECIQLWKGGAKEVGRIADAHRSFVSSCNSAIRSISRQISRNHRRMGLKPA